jgi:hypothetical protein
MIKQVQHNRGPTLMIGIPTLGRPVPLNWALSFKSLNPPINYNTVFHIINGAAVADARNEMAKQAIEKGCKYLFFLGDDVVVPNHTLRQLIYRMDCDDSIDVVGGVYCAKADPPFPLVFRGFGNGSYWDWKIGEFFEVTGLGMDCTLIRVDSLKKLTAPYFKTVESDQFLDAINNAESWTEDLYFFNKLKEIKGKVFCDGTVICEHWDVYGGIFYSLPFDSPPMRQMIIKKDKRCLVIGVGSDGDPAYETVTFGPETANYRGQLGQLPFDAKTFDRLVIMDTPLCFEQYLDEWERILKLNGEMFWHFPSPFISLPFITEWLNKQDKYEAKTYNSTIEIRFTGIIL